MLLRYLIISIVIVLNINGFTHACGSFENIFDCLGDENNLVQAKVITLQKEYTDQEILKLFATRYLTILEESSEVSIQAHIHYQGTSLRLAMEPDICLLALKNGMRHLLQRVEHDEELKNFLEIMDKHALGHEGLTKFLNKLRRFWSKAKTFVLTEKLDLKYTNLLNNFLKWAPSTEELYKVIFYFFLINSNINKALSDFWIMDYIPLNNKVPQVFTTWFMLVNKINDGMQIRYETEALAIKKILKMIKECLDETAEELTSLFLNTFHENRSEENRFNFTDQALIHLQQNFKKRENYLKKLLNKPLISGYNYGLKDFLMLITPKDFNAAYEFSTFDEEDQAAKVLNDYLELYIFPSQLMTELNSTGLIDFKGSISVDIRNMKCIFTPENEQLFLDLARTFLDLRLGFEDPSKDLCRAMFYYAGYLFAHMIFEFSDDLKQLDYPDDIVQLFKIPAFFEKNKSSQSAIKFLQSVKGALI